MKYTITVDVDDFQRRAIYYWQYEKMGMANDEETKDFLAAATEEWLDSITAEYPDTVEDKYQAAQRKQYEKQLAKQLERKVGKTTAR